MKKLPVFKEKDVKQSQEFKYPLCWNLMMKAKKLSDIKEICSWLPLGLKGQ